MNKPASTAKPSKVPLTGTLEGTIEVPTQPAKVGDKNIPPQTTAEQDTMTAGQRRVNLIWEITQSVVALAVTGATLYNATKLTLRAQPGEAAFLLLSNAFFLVIGFYFGRTNHTRTGGVGSSAGER